MFGPTQQLRKHQGSYPNQSFDAFIAAPSNAQLFVRSVTAVNGVQANNNIAIANTITNPHWKLFTHQVSDKELTASIQAGTAVSIFTTVTNEGFVLQAKSRFGLVCMNISQAQTGSPVYVYQYWNGTTWATLLTKNTPNFAATGQQSIVFNSPVDWVVGDGTEGGDQTLYSIRVVATTAPTQAVQINAMIVCNVISYRENIRPSAQLEVAFDDRPVLLQQGEAIVGFFSLSSNDNTMEATYQISP